MNPNHGIEIVRVSETVAINAARKQGFGNSHFLLKEARDIFLRNMSKLSFGMNVKNDRFANDPDVAAFPRTINGDVGGRNLDVMMIAVDGHKVTANGGPNAATYAALATENSFMNFPNVYMNKIVVNQEAYGSVDIEASAADNVKKVARALKKYIDNITVVFLKRRRNRQMIDEVRSCGARIQLIQDGDISAALATVFDGKVDIVMGYGGAQEGVITAAAMKCLGGYITGKLHVPDAADREAVERAGIADINRTYDINDFVSGKEVVIVGTGISEGYFLDGVRFDASGAQTHSFVARGETKTFRDIKTRHSFDYKKIF